MKKSFLEEKINDIAEARFQREWNEMIDFLYKHPIAKKLSVVFGEEALGLVNFGQNSGLLNHDAIGGISHTDYKAVKNELIEEYRKKESVNILKKLEQIEHLFEGNRPAE